MVKRLIVNNYEITAPMLDILTRLRGELTNGKLDVIENKGEYIRVTCPVHHEGHESHPSCSVYCGDGDIPYGTYNCFTCQSRGPLWEFVNKCFDKTGDFGKNWLINRFGDAFYSNTLELESIDLSVRNQQKQILDESILSQFEDYHPYMTKRKLTKEVIEKFKIKYDPLSRAIVFPVWDKEGNLSFLTRRCTDSKRFIIDKGADKRDIYLLNQIIKDNIKEVYVTESQINCLTLWGWGYPAIALFGAGTTKEQLDELNKTGIRHYILCYDPDLAGIEGAKKFISGIRKDVFVDVIQLPEGKDVNDLSKEEFECLAQR